MVLTRDQARNTLVGLRTAIGVGSIVAPRLTGRLFGIDPNKNPALPFIGRLFGIRELYMAAPFLMDEGDDLDRLLQRGIAVDAADGVAAVLAGARGSVPKRTTVLAGGMALLAVCLGAYASQDD